MSDSTLSKDAIVIERTFDAPIDLIWKLWTEAEHYTNWYGPEGFSVSLAEMDVRVGGNRLFCMEMLTPDGNMKMWLAGEYTEIVPTTRLVYTESMADEHGNILPPEGDFPAVTVITVLLEDLGERTKMHMTHAGVPASDEGANEGWQQALSKMADYAETVLKGKK